MKLKLHKALAMCSDRYAFEFCNCSLIHMPPSLKFYHLLVIFYVNKKFFVDDQQKISERGKIENILGLVGQQAISRILHR